jgi:CarboxypepD_reg-like domain/TonB-dependent Receptor Plug Domain
MRLFVAAICLLFSIKTTAQTKNAVISGRVVDEKDAPIAKASVTILGKNSGILCSDSGTFTIKVAANKAVALIFSHTGFKDVQKNFYLNSGEVENIIVNMQPGTNTLENVVVKGDKDRRETGLIKVNPKTAVIIPSTNGGVEALIKTLVGSNNELTSQYNVRGGNYDENLIYINDFEIYRPYLVSSGQQEGLSLINPEMTRNLNFYTGGFQAKYGDKMSSVLDIQYKKPTSFSGSAYISLLEQGLQLGNSSKNKKLSYLVGLRNKSNRNLLSNQPTKGAYIPSASDAQLLLTYAINSKISAEVLGIYSTARFTYFPESVKKTTSVFSPFFTANFGLDVDFVGQEKDAYSSKLLGLTVLQQVNKNLKLKWLASAFSNTEKENFDIAGSYVFGDRDFDNSSSTFGQIINPLGAGYYQNYGRNNLQITNFNFTHKGYLDKKNNYIQWGITAEQTEIKDKLLQFEYRDSAGYNLPYQPTSLNIYNVQNGTANLSITKLSGFIQDNVRLLKSSADISLQFGLRYNYNSLNKQFLLSPRAQLSYKPNGKRDIVYKVAAGLYSQPPFYRELRAPDGSIVKNITAQKSVQLVAGLDYNFIGLGNRALRFTTEAYYKSLTDVVPYDIDNVKIRYLGANNAKAYATGIEFRLFGELVKDAESWLSVNLMRTRENLRNDFYYDYKNAAGEVIGINTIDKVPVDSVQQQVGFVRRPSDRLITIGLYIEDYLPTNKNFKMHLNAIYGSNMSFNIPGATKYRNGLTINPYIRVDLGLSALLLSDKSNRRSHNLFKGIDNIWMSLEVFNLINRENTISYQLIKDFSNTVYALPNRLTPRLLNLKFVARF